MADDVQKKPTLRTIAALSGLAVPTVSRALNDAPDIGAKTKRRVRDIARQIGYVPNRAGVRLRTGKTNVVTLVLGADTDVTDHTGQLISSIAQALRDTRYHLNVTPYFPDEDPMTPVRYIVETEAADCVIMNRIEVEDRRIAYLMEREFPFVTFGRTIWCESHPYLDFDNTAFGRIAAETLVSAGRRNLALLPPPRDQNYSRNMIAGAGERAEQLGASFSIIGQATSDEPGEDIRAAVRDFLSLHPETDALICPSTGSTISAVVSSEAMGRTLGKDIDIFAKEAISFLRFFRPQIKSVTEDVRMAGTFLAKAAIQAIEHPELPPMQKLNSPRLVTTVLDP